MALTLSGTNGVVGAGFTVDASGVSVTAGVGTFSSVRGTHHGDGANLTALPAAQITGTLPAISAANLTNIPAANITGTLPAISGANLTGITAGITNLDQWYVSSNFTGSVNPISSNLARYTTAGGYLGSGMSESSGTFTFPTTGFWKIDVEGTITRIEGGRQSRHAEINILATTNNSSYSTISQAQTGYFDNYDAGYRYIGCFSSVVFDCTDTSTHKIRFQTVVQDNDSQGCRWDTPYLKMAFIKLADT